MPSSINTGTTTPKGFFCLSRSSVLIVLLVALTSHRRPDMVDMTRVSAQTNRSNLEHAFCVAEQLGVARLLDPEGEI